MHYDTHRQHGTAHASPGNPHRLHVVEHCECLLDKVERTARPEREAQRVMDRLLRECLQRRPLG